MCKKLIVILFLLLCSCKGPKLVLHNITVKDSICAEHVDNTELTVNLAKVKSLEAKSYMMKSAYTYGSSEDYGHIEIPRHGIRASTKSEANDEIDFGVITYYIPDTLKWNETKFVEVRITKDKKSKKIILNNYKDIVIDTIPVTSMMKVVLHDIEHSFKIDTLSTATQWVEDNSEYTTWRWSIKAIKSGRHELSLTINIISDGRPKDIPVVTYKVFVVSESLKNKAEDIIKDKIDWTKIISLIITGALIPGFIFLWKRKKK